MACAAGEPRRHLSPQPLHLRFKEGVGYQRDPQSGNRITAAHCEDCANIIVQRITSLSGFCHVTHANYMNVRPHS